MSIEGLLPLERFRRTLEIVRRESHHLVFSHAQLFQEPIGADWVTAWDRNPELAERLEASVSRCGRIQDTIADKLLPRWLLAIDYWRVATKAAKPQKYRPLYALPVT